MSSSASFVHVERRCRFLFKPANCHHLLKNYNVWNNLFNAATGLHCTLSPSLNSLKEIPYVAAFADMLILFFKAPWEPDTMEKDSK